MTLSVLPIMSVSSSFKASIPLADKYVGGILDLINFVFVCKHVAEDHVTLKEKKMNGDRSKHLHTINQSYTYTT